MAINSLSALNAMSMNRIGGLTSGMDTDSIVKGLMRVQQAKYDKMVQAKTRDEWKKTAYTDINNAIRKFKDEYASFLGGKNMLAVSSYKSYKVDMPANASLSATASASAREGSYTVSVERLASGAALTGTAASSNGAGFSASVIAGTKIENITGFASGETVSGEINFTVNGKEFTFQSTDTMKKIMDTVNSSDAGVRMSYSQLTNAFVIENKMSGAQAGANNLTVQDTSGFLSAIGLGSEAVRTDAQTAQLTVNGISIERDSNNFEIDGVNFNLTKVTDATISFTVKQDVQAGVDAIKGMVDAYNSLMTSLHGKMTEKKIYGYAPLTDEQRTELGEKDAALWDDKAKAGMMYNNPALRALTDAMQRAFSSAIGDMGTLSSLGISGSNYKPGQPNLIQLDESKLRAALETDADKVYRMFTDRVDDAGGKIDVGKSGLVQRLTSAMDTFVNQTKDINLKSLDDSIRGWEDKLRSETTRLFKMQESYYKKFAAMETAMAKMQSQTSALAGMGY